MQVDNSKRWRLILGGGQADGTGEQLSGELKEMDQALEALYDYDKAEGFRYNPEGGTGKSNPSVARWLGDIRKYFPMSVVNVMQNDAMNKPGLKEKLIYEPEILEKATPDVHLVASLMELGKLIPEKTKDTARAVVKKVVDELMEKLEQKTVAALRGAINKSVRNLRPRHNEINWDATIRKNLRNFLPEYNTIIPETRVGYGHKSRRSMKDIILCVDQSGSMGTSVVYSAIFGAVMSSIPQVHTDLVVFDTEIADLTEDLNDPIDLLFGVQLGGGTDINKALKYCQGKVKKPDDTILVLITDLYENGNQKRMLQRMEELKKSGVQVICLLALNDEGEPWYHADNAKALANMSIPCFSSTPDLFPDLMATAIQNNDLNMWAAENNIVMK